LYKWKRRGIKPNEYTFSVIINARAAPAGGEQGKQLHAWSIKSRFNNALFVSSVLLTMHSKRGDIKSAYKVFKRQRERFSVMEFHYLWICTAWLREESS
jgi:hypothetical protein